MPALRAVQGEHGDVWIMMNDKVLLYIAKDGTLCVKGDVVGSYDVPDPPP
jgi:hypothetical protein